MSQQSSDGSNPILPAVLMLGVLAVLMFAMLGSNPPRVIEIPPTVEVMLPTVTPVPTEVPTTEPMVPTPWLQTIDATDGETLYLQACAGCHGLEGEGIEGIAPALQTSTLLDDEAEALVRFITSDQPVEVPYEGFTHPYRGGYPALTDDQIETLAEFVRGFGTAE
jgi:mono/diheme cytochrome c family protein